MKASTAQVFFFLVCSSSTLYYEAIATVEPHRDNFHKHEHFDADHKHDERYDHEAFLGPDAEKFEHLTSEESKRRLRVIAEKKIDTNKDGLLSFNELMVWIEKQRKVFMYEAVEERIAKEDKNGDGEVSWEEYSNVQFMGWNETTLPKDHSLHRQIRKAKYKFEMADEDQNGRLNSDEYVNFEHPEETKKMEEIGIDEVIEDVDQNDDGFISMVEFLAQFNDQTTPPSWVVRHRREMHERFDTNSDGKIDREEARAWVLPERNESKLETEHLIAAADDNKDGLLSINEIMQHWNLFVGSHATDHGRTLRKVKHEEL